jgi:hypothetical protein
MPSEVRTFSDLGPKQKTSIFRDYGWASVTIANAGVTSGSIDIGPADSVMLVLPAGVNTKTITMQTTYDGTTWIDLVSWTAATGIKVFTDATELAKIRHAQVTRFTVNSAVGADSKIWISLKG